MTTQALDIEDPAALAGYLRRSGRIASDAQPRISVLAGGVSNRTVLVENGPAERWVIKQALAQLRVQAEWFSDPSRIAREAIGLRELPALTPPGSIPTLIFEDPPLYLLAMAAVPEPHQNWKQLLLAGDLQPGHVQQFAQILGQIHAQSHDQAATLAPRLADSSFFESLRLEPYYSYSAGQAPAAAAFLGALTDETRRQQIALVHGDYSPKNILVHAGQLILLDHEVIHWGDPAFDLGFALTHLLSKAHHLPGQRGAFAAAAQQFWATYRSIIAARFGAELEARAVRHLAACLLARVVGRSPLEYLGPAARERQRAAALALIAAPPRNIPATIARFLEELT